MNGHTSADGARQVAKRDGGDAVIDGTEAVIQSVRAGTPLQPCTTVFRDHPPAKCLSMGELAREWI